MQFNARILQSKAEDLKTAAAESLVGLLQKEEKTEDPGHKF